MCYRCEKDASINGIDKYDVTTDLCITRARIVSHIADGLI
jgi:hypothetical protein